MLLWKKGKPKQKIFFNRLSIKFKDNSILGWIHKNTEKQEAFILPWKSFYKWYFGRINSDSFIMRYKDGETMLRRSNIESFTIRVWTEEI